MSIISEASSQLQQLLDQKYQELSLEKKKKLYELFKSKNTQEATRKQLEKIIFKVTPPTPEEFLDPANKWLSQKIIDGIWPEVRKQFVEILTGFPHYYKVGMYGCTRVGKTFIARLLIIYTIIWFHCLREPAMYYGLSPLTELAIYLISFKFEKTRQVYLQPIYKILKQSEKFIQIESKEKVIDKQREIGNNKIVWCKSAVTGEITLASGLQIQLGNTEALSFIGADAIQAYISEIAYFIEYAGTTEETIFRLYTDISERIEATVGNSYLAYTYLDTSANLSESLIEKHMIEQLQFEEGVYFKWNSRWDITPWKCPQWQSTGETFKVITGSADFPAKIIKNDKELDNIPRDLVVEVPIDFYKRFRDNLLRSIKDIAGRPTNNENKFITETQLITNIFSNSTLQNIEGIIIADASEMPEELLWNKIKNKFFVTDINGKFIIKRAPKEKRYIGLDNAYSLMGDIMGFATVHKEWSIEKKQVMYIIDWCFPLGPREKGINLDAPIYFILDLNDKAFLPIKGLYTDSFESEAQKQFLNRRNIEVFIQSVDEDLNPYQYFLTCLSNELIKGGKNIFLRNNLSCLIKEYKSNKKEKINHPKGPTNNKYLGEWDKSTCGLFAKDVSDAVCHAVYAAYCDTAYSPITIYEEENKKFESITGFSQQLISTAFDKLHKISV
jgi:hypothetical protein